MGDPPTTRDHNARWLAFGIGLALVALIGIAATVVGIDGPGRPDDAAAVVGDAPATSTTAAPTTTSTTTTSTSTTTAVTSTTTAPPATTTPTPTTRAAPATTTPTPTTRPTTTTPPPTTTPTPTPAERRRIAQHAAVVAHTTGHQPSGYPSMASVIAPALRPSLEVLTRPAAYRDAGCRQRVTSIVPGPVSDRTFGFSLVITRTCDRVPMVGGQRLPLTNGVYTSVTVGPAPDGSWWATSLTSE